MFCVTLKRVSHIKKILLHMIERIKKSFRKGFVAIVSAIPIFWKCLIKRYLSFFSMATGTLVALLITSRLEEIARFVALGASSLKIFLFILLQIPYILQLALPIGAFIAAYSLSSRMSQTGELTSCRSFGKSIIEIYRPVFVFSGLIALLTFLFLFDISAKSHLATKKLEYDVQAEEPLALLQSGHFLDAHSIALELSGSFKTGSTAHNVLLCLMPKGQERLTLLFFRKTTTEEGSLTGDSLTIFSSSASTDPKHPHATTMYVENAGQKKTPIHYLHEMTQTKKWKVGPDHMPMSSIIAMQRELYDELQVEKYEEDVSKNLIKRYGRFVSEPWRRISLSLGILTLTYAGVLFGIFIQRTKKTYRLAIALIPFFVFMGLYLMGKNIDEMPYIAIGCFLISHILVYILASIKKKHIEEGTSS